MTRGANMCHCRLALADAVIAGLLVLALGCGSGSDETQSAADAGVSTTALALGTHFSCALLSNGGVKCWGGNMLGELGDGMTESSRATPAYVPGLETGVTNLSASETGACAVRSDGTVVCWGDNDSGQNGVGTTGPAPVSTPTPVVGITNAKRVSRATWHACALLLDGTIACWGKNSDGQLGDGTTTDSATPVIVKTSAKALEVSSGAEHTCARFSGGAVWCWGSALNSDLGDGTFVSESAPVAVVGLTGAVSVHSGWSVSCSTVGGGAVECWGNNGCGELGDGTNVDLSPSPVAVVGLKGIKQMSMGYCTSCAVTASGDVERWGGYTFPDAGGPQLFQNTPIVVGGFSGPAAECALSNSRLCVRLVSGEVQCMSTDQWGEPGDNMAAPTAQPMTVVGLP